MGIADEVAGVGQRAVGVQRDHAALVRPDAVGIGGDVAQALVGHQVGVGAGVVGHREVVGALGGGAQQLHELPVGLAAADPVADRLQVGDFERLDMDRGPAGREIVLAQRGDQPVFQRQADRLEIGRVLGLGVEADVAAAQGRLVAGERDDLGQRRDVELVVVGRVVRADVGDALAGAQGLQFGQREVFREPAGDALAVDGLGGAAAGELRQVSHVGGAGDFVLVARDQHAVLGGDEVRLDDVGAIVDGLLV